jgi:hypothetical protein
MKSYKEPGIEARRQAAAEARAKALATLKARAPIDPAVQADRLAVAEAREKARALKSEAAREARASALAAKSGKGAATDESSSAINEVDRKAARDARYASRKDRQNKVADVLPSRTKK